MHYFRYNLHFVLRQISLVSFQIHWQGIEYSKAIPLNKEGTSRSR